MAAAPPKGNLKSAFSGDKIIYTSLPRFDITSGSNMADLKWPPSLIYKKLSYRLHMGKLEVSMAAMQNGMSDTQFGLQTLL